MQKYYLVFKKQVNFPLVYLCFDHSARKTVDTPCKCCASFRFKLHITFLCMSLLLEGFGRAMRPCAVRTLLLCFSTHKTGHCAPLSPPHTSQLRCFIHFLYNVASRKEKSTKSASLGKTALVKDRVNKASFMLR